MHVVAVVGLEIVCLQRDTLHAEAVILRDQFLRSRRILHALADAFGDVGRKLGVGRLIGKDFLEIAEPDPEAGLVVELVP